MDAFDEPTLSIIDCPLVARSFNGLNLTTMASHRGRRLRAKIEPELIKYSSKWGAMRSKPSAIDGSCPTVLAAKQSEAIKPALLYRSIPPEADAEANA